MKNKINYILAGLLLGPGLFSCKKEVFKQVNSSSLTITNAIFGDTVLVANFNSSQPLKYYGDPNVQDNDDSNPLPHFYRTPRIHSYEGYEYGGYLGDIPLSVAQLNDTTHTVFKHTINVAPGSINTLFLTGTVTNPDYFYTRDTITRITKPGTVNIRFVNLVRGGNPVIIAIKDTLGAAAGPVTGKLAYKSITSFKSFSTFFDAVNPSGLNTKAVFFEVRDAVTNEVLPVTYFRHGATDQGDANGYFLDNPPTDFFMYQASRPGGTNLPEMVDYYRSITINIAGQPGKMALSVTNSLIN